MKKGLTIVAVAALALGAAACHKSPPADNNVSAEENMLVPADENAMGDNMAVDNSAMTDDNAAGANSTNAM
jgi:hypothetical protein